MYIYIYMYMYIYIYIHKITAFQNNSSQKGKKQVTKFQFSNFKLQAASFR